mgnify:CR=1 FL=1
MNIISVLEQEQLRDDIPAFRPGDTVKVHVKVVEGNRERIQIFEGVVIGRHNGGVRETFTVRRISYASVLNVLSWYIRRVWLKSKSFATVSFAVQNCTISAVLPAKLPVSANADKLLARTLEKSLSQLRRAFFCGFHRRPKGYVLLIVNL